MGLGELIREVETRFCQCDAMIGFTCEIHVKIDALRDEITKEIQAAASKAILKHVF